MSKVDLKVDWATHAAAKHACLNWHYSKCLPAGKLVKIGAWENGGYIGCVVFGRGANNRMATAYGLQQDQACELVRIALTPHDAPVTRIVAQAIRFLKHQGAGLRLIISYADPKQGHHGGIYQAGNWVYQGRSQAQRGLLIEGIFTHKRSAHARYGTASPERIFAVSGKHVEWAPVEWKHIYLMPLDKKMRKQILPLSKPYPKKQASEAGDDRDHRDSGGAAPTRTLQDIGQIAELSTETKGHQ